MQKRSKSCSGTFLQVSGPVWTTLVYQVGLCRNGHSGDISDFLSNRENTIRNSWSFDYGVSRRSSRNVNLTDLLPKLAPNKHGFVNENGVRRTYLGWQATGVDPARFSRPIDFIRKDAFFQRDEHLKAWFGTTVVDPERLCRELVWIGELFLSRYLALQKLIWVDRRRSTAIWTRFANWASWIK